jgi:hypothetical protein
MHSVKVENAERYSHNTPPSSKNWSSLMRRRKSHTLQVVFGPYQHFTSQSIAFTSQSIAFVQYFAHVYVIMCLFVFSLQPSSSYLSSNASSREKQNGISMDVETLNALQTERFNHLHLRNKLIKLNVLGRGGTSCVWRMVHSSSLRIVAMKEVLVLDPVKMKQILNEIDMRAHIDPTVSRYIV